MTTHDRPWRRPGRLGYAMTRVRGAIRPPVEVVPLREDVDVAIDVEIPVRDGTILRANVFRPRTEEPVPAILSAHPYGKDAVPANTRSGRGLNPQFRVLRQPAPIRISDRTSWEAPDPDVWTGFGYAAVNLDVRGAGRSDGVGDLMSDSEADDIHDVIEWIAAQPWCDGGVAMLGVSYLAIAQYKAAATRPPHLRAIVPWEGFTDAYRDLFFPGGVEERGFSRLWTTLVRRATRMRHDLGAERRAHPLDDAFWRSLVPALDRIEVPVLVCGSFSDDDLHTRGSFRAFARAGSPERHLYTHRGGKWATFYAPEAVRAQRAFLDRHLRGGDAVTPRVRLEVRERGDAVAEVRHEDGWPLARTRWTTLVLSRDGRLVPGDPALDDPAPGGPVPEDPVPRGTAASGPEDPGPGDTAASGPGGPVPRGTAASGPGGTAASGPRDTAASGPRDTAASGPRDTAASGPRGPVPRGPGPEDPVPGVVRFPARRGAATFRHVFAEDTEVTGPASVRLHVSVDGADDASLFVGIAKWSGGRPVPFEGSYGFGRDLVATGWQRLLLRRPIPGDPHVPDHDLAHEEPLPPGGVAEVEVALSPSSTLFRAGEELRLHVSGRALSPRNPLFGSFPALYRPSPRSWIVLHLGGPHPASLELPVIPRP